LQHEISLQILKLIKHENTQFREFSASCSSFHLLSFLACFTGLQAQPRQLMIGKVTEAGLQEAVPFANIALFDSAGMTLVAGAISDMDGLFVINGDAIGCHSLRVSALGFATLNLPVEIVEEAAVDLGELFLTSTDIILDGVVVIGERIKATAGTDKTTFNINKKNAGCLQHRRRCA
jgi:hypothetical protein